MDAPPAADRAPDEPRAAGAVNVVRGPAWVFVALAAIVAILGGIALPIDLLPSDLWAYRPLQLADGIATILLGAALFGRRPDVWTTCRPLGAAVILLAIGALMGTAGSLAVLIAWWSALGLPGNLAWTVLGLGYIEAALGVLGIALIWLGLRRSIRQANGHGSSRLSVILWAWALLLVIGNLASTVRMLDTGGASVISVIAGTRFPFGIASLVALTALTVTAIAGARGRERPTSAWWLAGASGLIVILGGWLGPVLGMIVDEPVLPLLLPLLISLVSTLLLLLALALGLPSLRGHAPRPASDGV